MKTKLTWKRPRRREIETAILTVWATKESDLRVVRVVSLYHLPTRFVAMEGDRRILSEHRSRRAAEKACEKVWRHQ